MPTSNIIKNALLRSAQVAALAIHAEKLKASTMTQDEYFEHEAAKAHKPSNKVLVDREDLEGAIVALLYGHGHSIKATEQSFAVIERLMAALNGGAE